MSSEASLDTTYESLPSKLCCQLPRDTIMGINLSSSSSDLEMWEGICDLSIPCSCWEVKSSCAHLGGFLILKSLWDRVQGTRHIVSGQKGAFVPSSWICFPVENRHNGKQSSYHVFYLKDLFKKSNACQILQTMAVHPVVGRSCLLQQLSRTLYLKLNIAVLYH